jgi:hypothetical protein
MCGIGKMRTALRRVGAGGQVCPRRITPASDCRRGPTQGVALPWAFSGMGLACDEVIVFLTNAKD